MNSAGPSGRLTRGLPQGGNRVQVLALPAGALASGQVADFADQVRRGLETLNGPWGRPVGTAAAAPGDRGVLGSVPLDRREPGGPSGEWRACRG
jgi:hypothetical protein